MPVLLAEFIGAVLRALLAGAAGFFVQRGILTQSQSDMMTLAFIAWALALGWSLWAKYKGRIKFVTALESTTEAEVTDKISRGDTPKAMSLLLPLLLITGLSVGCGAARHVAVQVDASFATAVFAASDAALEACNQNVFTPAQCTVGGSVNRNAQQALIDVKAVTQALQDAPTSAEVPKTLPDLLTSLSNLQTLVGDLAPTVPSKQALATKIQAALAQAIQVIRAFTGGA